MCVVRCFHAWLHALTGPNRELHEGLCWQSLPAVWHLYPWWTQNPSILYWPGPRRCKHLHHWHHLCWRDLQILSSTLHSSLDHQSQNWALQPSHPLRPSGEQAVCFLHFCPGVPSQQMPSPQPCDHLLWLCEGGAQCSIPCLPQLHHQRMFHFNQAQTRRFQKIPDSTFDEVLLSTVYGLLSSAVEYDKPRTSNASEGGNNALNRAFNTAHPSMWTFISTLRKFPAEVEIKYQHMSVGTVTSEPVPRDGESGKRGSSTLLRATMYNLADKLDFLRKIGYLFWIYNFDITVLCDILYFCVIMIL